MSGVHRHYLMCVCVPPDRVTGPASSGVPIELAQPIQSALEEVSVTSSPHVQCRSHCLVMRYPLGQGGSLWYRNLAEIVVLGEAAPHRDRGTPRRAAEPASVPAPLTAGNAPPPRAAVEISPPDRVGRYPTRRWARRISWNHLSRR